MATSADAGLSLASVAAYKTARDRERELRHANTKLFRGGRTPLPGGGLKGADRETDRETRTLAS